MPIQGRSVRLYSRRHPVQVCPYRRRGRREVIVTHAGVQALQPSGSAGNAAPSRFQQLVWIQSHEPQPRHLNGTSGSGPALQLPGVSTTPGAGLGVGPGASEQRVTAIELMTQIKAARSWQQLEAIVDANARSMNYLHISAVVTHMAQLHTSSSSGDFGLNSGGSSTTTHAPWRPDALSAAAVGRRSANGDGLWIGQHSGRQEATASSTGRAGQQPSSGSGRQPPTPSIDGSSDSRTGTARGGLSRARPAPRDLFLQRLERGTLAHLRDFQPRQIANTLWAMAKLGHRPASAWLEAVLTHGHGHLAAFEPQHLANTLYALMLLGYMPPAGWLTEFFMAAEKQMQRFGPAEVAQLCYAAGKLRLRPGPGLLGYVIQHSGIHMQKYGMRELALLLYGIVHMGGRPHAEWMRSYRLRVTALVIASGALPSRFLRRVAPQLNRPLAELVKLQIHQQQAQQQAKQAAGGSNEQPSVSGRRGPGRGLPGAHSRRRAHTAPEVRQRNGISGSEEALAVSSYVPTVFMTMANMGYQPPPVFVAVALEAFSAVAKRLDVASVTSLLQSLAFLRCKPQEQWFQSMWKLVADSGDNMEAQHATQALWAASRLGCPIPRRCMRAMLMRAALRLSQHSDVEAVALLEAAAGFDSQGLPRECLSLLESDLYARLPRLRPLTLAATLKHVADLRHKPHRVWIARWSEAMYPGLQELGLQQLSSVAYAAAQLGYRPPSGLRTELLAAAGRRLALAAAEVGTGADGAPTGQPWQHGAASAQAACRARLRPFGVAAAWQPAALGWLLWGLALLDLRPDEAWMDSYLTCLRLALPHLSRRELSLVVWALARLRHDPGPALMEVFRRRAGAGAAAAAAGAAAATGSAGGDVRPFEVPIAGEGELALLAGSLSAPPYAPIPASAAAAAAGVGSPGAKAAAVLGGQAPMWQRGFGVDSTGEHSGDGVLARHGGRGAAFLPDFSGIILQGIVLWAAQQLSDSPPSTGRQLVGAA